MRKSKYLVLSSFYFNFNDDLSEIKEIKELFENQNILDLFRFDKIKIIIAEEFSKHENFNFVSKLIPDLFQYVIDYKTSEIRVSLKQSVAIAGLVTALMIKNKNKFTKREKAQIEKELSKISSVKNINKFV